MPAPMDTVDGNGRFFENESSSLNEDVRKRSGEEGVGLQATAYSPPVSKCLVRQVGQIKGLPLGESGGAIVVSLMPGFLKLDVGRGDVYQVTLAL